MSILQGREPAAIRLAAERLAAGELVALPTETVYGLGARADDPAAVARIFAAKGRPSDHPLIVHVPDVASAQAFAASWPASAQRLTHAFWPGPVTVIVPRRAGLAEAAAGGQDSIGLRCPAHPVALAVLKAAAALGVPGVAAPSANGFGRVSPTSAAHVAGEFGDGLLVLDGGDCEVGIESTIVDCTRARPVLLRPGRLTRAELEAVLGEPLLAPDAAAPRASGTLEAHYAPRAKVRVMDAAQLQAALQLLGAGEPQGRPLAAVYSRTVRPADRRMPYRAMPQDAAAAAHELFAALRALDALGVPLIWIETPPADAAWEGVRDRLQRAAAA
ncbi:threonylcarbamoyl-AMP synthase [Ideonella azotifigens]|uniref:Threonylcarbamoyl-AMP synthase n=2 Tax=Ideonella azotifigens TaxID=513160 RepID=A0ABN1K9G7_9BURK|nr:L-threonylcarbamoyladenylate synthase [Ideonella azotifigens]MCD2339044.1 threonylcarbamoyl-AMP synthase [Ideonella azotifigens]